MNKKKAYLIDYGSALKVMQPKVKMLGQNRKLGIQLGRI